jgi:hypothetical protein
MANKNKKKKSNFEDTSFKTSPEMRELLDQQEALDPMQIDLEDQIKEEETKEEIVEEKEYPVKLTRFKNPLMEVQLSGVSQLINNSNITNGDIQFMINNNIMSESEFK